MRLWSLHPSYLDVKGLVALWRESLLAQKVLFGDTKGYRNHPQLDRFKAAADPKAAISTYLCAIVDEADARGYNFDRSKIGPSRSRDAIPVTTGQIAYEFSHLLKKLAARDPERYQSTRQLDSVRLHPQFTEVPGEIESWEIVD